jgi:4-aminobutyrate--pyruvate transaminase
VGEARGVGLIGGLEIVADKTSKAQYPPERKAAPLIMGKAAEEGLFVRAVGGDTIGICPPLIITEAEIDDLFDRVERSLDKAAADLR